jgi:hypothetical protein
MNPDEYTQAKDGVQTDDQMAGGSGSRREGKPDEARWTVWRVLEMSDCTLAEQVEKVRKATEDNMHDDPGEGKGIRLPSHGNIQPAPCPPGPTDANQIYMLLITPESSLPDHRARTLFCSE